MATVVSSKPATELPSDSDSVGKNAPKGTVVSAALLGKPRPERKFWFQKRKDYDPTATATLSIGLEIDRANLSQVLSAMLETSIESILTNSQALTDNFLNDLGLTTNDYNMGNTLFSLSFLCAELPSQLVSKWIGPDRWIPTQLVLWSLVACCQFKLNGLASFLICRCLLVFLQGGFIPDVSRITLRLLWRSVCDYDLWPIYLIGFTFLVPGTTPGQYLTLSLRGLGFNTFHTNLLLLAWSAFAQIWMLPFLIWLRVVDSTKVSRWTVWIVMTLMLTKPMPHPIQVNLVSHNSNAVRSRTVSAALYNMCVQVSNIIGSNIYRADDAPVYWRGNSVLLGIVAWNLCLYAGSRAYYIWRNNVRAKKWDALQADEKVAYLDQNEHGGSKRLDFRFAY
ncbi:mfs general substrate transporter [Colletotrichum incanum]|uniref:Mfs general substrate transporter n=1 Tax=Colletotrichum incanum TaxID=1573173 RepID=A0A167CGB6_COLIC|nr:mfs general substrate transporter [Colletotrichum incanum]